MIEFGVQQVFLRVGCLFACGDWRRDPVFLRVLDSSVSRCDRACRVYLTLAQGSKIYLSSRRSFAGSITVLKADRRWCSSHPLGHANDPFFFLNNIFLHCLHRSIALILTFSLFVVYLIIGLNASGETFQPVISTLLPRRKVSKKLTNTIYSGVIREHVNILNLM